MFPPMFLSIGICSFNSLVFNIDCFNCSEHNHKIPKNRI